MLYLGLVGAVTELYDIGSEPRSKPGKLQNITIDEKYQKAKI